MLTEVRVKKSKKDKEPVAVKYDFGSSLTESAKLFDGPTSLDNVVHGLFLAAARQQLQDHVRSLMAEKKTKAKGKPGKPGYVAPKLVRAALSPEQIQAEVANWRPTVQKQSKRSIDKASKVIGNLSPLERAILLEQLKASERPEQEIRLAGASARTVITDDLDEAEIDKD